MELVVAKQLAADALFELEATKELVSQACAELEKVRESESESVAQTECKKAQIKLESILLNSIRPFQLILSPG